MSDLDLEQVMTDAVARVDGQARPDDLASRLRRVDRRRRAGVLATMTVAVAALTAGVAAAWPEGPPPFELRVGVDQADEATADVDTEAADETDGPAVDDQAEPRPVAVPDWTEPLDVTTTPETEPTPFTIDFGAVVSGSEATPTPAPTPPPTQAPAAQPTPAPKAPEPEPTATPKPAGKKKGKKKNRRSQQAVTFTAVAQYGSCEEEIPYDNYSGTAAPGANVTITSPWSATHSVTADAGGHWAVQVTFEAAPVGQPFTVTAESDGAVVQLSFVRTG